MTFHATFRITPLPLLAALLAASCNGDSPTPDAAPPDAGVVDILEAGPPADGGCPLDLAPEPDIPTPTLFTPRWAFEPWISKDISDTADTYAFVDGFRSRQIPVGAVVIDSPWETNYTTFVPSPTRYPDFAKMVKEMHDRGVRVVMWVTQMVNSASFDLESGGDTYPGPSPNFDEGQRCGFYVNGGATYLWWKGTGAGLDFFDRRAVAWWHRQQDPLLATGIDGWKLDFGESYLPWADLSTDQGKVAFQSYSEEYYRDFWAYGVQQRGAEFVTMVRGWDESYQFKGRFHARPEHAPVIWAGDNRRDWIGLADALDHIFRSAAAGYVVVGSDIGGYLDIDDKDMSSPVPFDQDTFVRWVALGALCPFMQLHGRANLTPWTVQPRTQETVDLYRYWATLHSELVPFWYSLSREAQASGGKPGVLRPVGAEADWPGDYRYQLGEAFLVAPILDGTGKRDVDLPAGAQWYDWWDPAAAPLAGGTTLTAYDATDQSRTLPLFVREGAIVPLAVSSDVTGLGTAASKGSLGLLVYPGAQPSSFRLREDDDTLTTITTRRPTPTSAEITLSRAPRPVILRVRAEAAPTKVNLDGTALTLAADRAGFDAATSGFLAEPAQRRVWIKIPAAAGAASITLE